MLVIDVSKNMILADEKMRKFRGKKGFTLVELSLSIAFIAILSITIVLIINNAIATYRRGLTLNQINTVGMDLVDDMRAVIQNSPASGLSDMCNRYSDSTVRQTCEEDGASKFVLITKIASKIKQRGEELMENVPTYGAFCSGAYSYVWNSGYNFVQNIESNEGLKRAKLNYDDGNSIVDYDNFRLIKVRDKDREVCASALSDGKYKEDEDIDTFKVNGKEEPEIILANDAANSLALYDLLATVPASNGAGEAFYSVSFVLGTLQGGINVKSGGNFCTAPEGFDSNFDYCAINKFNFAAQANGG